MSDLGNTTSIELASSIIKNALNNSLNVTSVKPLHGGMVNRVEKWKTDGDPSAIVAKMNPKADFDDFKTEFDSLNWYQANTSFPVPKPLSVSTGNDVYSGSYLLMEYIPAPNLELAKISPSGMQKIQLQLADILADLHDITRDTYGSALDTKGPGKWLDVFTPRITFNFEKCASKLSRQDRSVIEKMLSDLLDWLPETNHPTLVHGDVWAANILVDDSSPDDPNIKAFVDSNALFADVEYELAYLRIFSTADENFFSRYTDRHQIKDGFQDRCLVYWLNTMMIHLWMFGPSYLTSCENLIGRIAAMS